MLSQIISYNPYDKAQADWHSEEKRLERSQKFEMFLMKYAMPKDKAYSSNSGSGDDSDYSLSQIDEKDNQEDDAMIEEEHDHANIEAKKYHLSHLAPTDASCKVCNQSSPYKRRWREQGMLKEPKKKTSPHRKELNSKQQMRDKLLNKAGAYLRKIAKASVRNSKNVNNT